MPLFHQHLSPGASLELRTPGGAIAATLQLVECNGDAASVLLTTAMNAQLRAFDRAHVDLRTGGAVVAGDVLDLVDAAAALSLVIVRAGVNDQLSLSVDVPSGWRGYVHRGDGNGRS